MQSATFDEEEHLRVCGGGDTREIRKIAEYLDTVAKCPAGNSPRT